ncbi:uncharacterized [Tachysurus ichikawai]
MSRTQKQTPDEGGAFSINSSYMQFDPNDSSPSSASVASESFGGKYQRMWRPCFMTETKTCLVMGELRYCYCKSLLALD